MQYFNWLSLNMLPMEDYIVTLYIYIFFSLADQVLTTNVLNYIT